MLEQRPHESFVYWCRHALRYLYDPIALRKNSLYELLGCQEQGPSLLRGKLVAAVEGLKPSAELPRESVPWRTYHILLFRFVEQFSQTEVADNLGVSARQLRRKEAIAIETLAEHLWAAHVKASSHPEDDKPLAIRPGASASASPDVEILPGAEFDTADSTSAPYSKELKWIGQSAPSEMMNLEAIVRASIETVSTLIHEMGVRTQFSPAPSVPTLVVQPATLRQAILSLLAAAANYVPGGTIIITLQVHDGEIALQICTRARGSTFANLSAQQTGDLKIAEDLVALSGGRLELLVEPRTDNPFQAKVILPVVKQIPVLVADDNADTLQLFQRYITGTRFHFIGAQDPHQVMEAAIRSQARIIVLDAMLPEVDGWQLLGRLREHPDTRHIPVVICTILPQDQLASILGAAGFLRKPVKRDDFVGMLNQLAEELATGS